MNTLLYLEDDEALAMVTIRAMTKRGFALTHYRTLKDTIADSQHFSHALLDLRVEDGNALEIVDLLRARNPDIKILILTGYASITSAVQAIKMGAVNYLAKPVSADQIMAGFEENTATPLIADDDQLSLKRMEWEHIQQALADNDGNISAAARQLKMHRRTLQRKLAKKPSVV